MQRTDFEEKIKKESIWNIATPSVVAHKLPLYGLEGGIFIAEEGYEVTRSFHDSFLMLYTLEGEGIVNDTLLKSGYVMVIDCHKPHSYKANGNWKFMWLHYEGLAAASFYELMLTYCPNGSPVPSSFTGEMNAVINSFFMQDTISLLSTSEAIQGLLSKLISAPLMTESAEISSAVEYIHSHFQEQIHVEDICSYVNLSKYHFIRCFKRSLGVTPYAYLTNYRITKAKRMLAESTLSVDETAHACGFLDTANFIAAFKTHTGISPLKYKHSAILINPNTKPTQY